MWSIDPPVADAISCAELAVLVPLSEVGLTEPYAFLFLAGNSVFTICRDRTL